MDLADAVRPDSRLSVWQPGYVSLARSGWPLSPTYAPPPPPRTTVTRVPPFADGGG